MKLFIDSGSLKEIESLVPLAIIDGITTNPSLLAKEGGDPRMIRAGRDLANDWEKAQTTMKV